jgi:hypothetical protein
MAKIKITDVNSQPNTMRVHPSSFSALAARSTRIVNRAESPSFSWHAVACSDVCSAVAQRGAGSFSVFHATRP